MARLNKSSLLSQELINTFGTERAKELLNERLSLVLTTPENTPPPKLSAEIINDRQKEHSRKQNEHAEKLRQLNQERLKLIEEREKLEERRRFLTSTDSPVSGSQVDPESRVAQRPTEAQDLDSLIRGATQNITKQASRLWQLREEYDKRQRQLYRPYDGELGLDSYKPWQIPHYKLARSIVEEVVDKVIERLFSNSYMNNDTGRAFREKERLQLQKVLALTSEQRAVQLVAESIILQVTAKMASEVAHEVALAKEMVQSMTNVSLMQLVESITTGDPEGRSLDDPLYGQFTRAFLRRQKERDKYRKEVWGHTQPSYFAGPRGLVFDDESDEGELTTAPPSARNTPAPPSASNIPGPSSARNTPDQQQSVSRPVSNNNTQPSPSRSHAQGQKATPVPGDQPATPDQQRSGESLPPSRQGQARSGSKDGQPEAKPDNAAAK